MATSIGIMGLHWSLNWSLKDEEMTWCFLLASESSMIIRTDVHIKNNAALLTRQRNSFPPFVCKSISLLYHSPCDVGLSDRIWWRQDIGRGRSTRGLLSKSRSLKQGKRTALRPKSSEENTDFDWLKTDGIMRRQIGNKGQTRTRENDTNDTKTVTKTRKCKVLSSPGPRFTKHP